MTQKEFMERAGVVPTSEEFDYIHAVYMNTSMDKDEFCKDFKKHGGSSVLRDVHARAVNFELQDKQKAGTHRGGGRISNWQSVCLRGYGLL